MSKKPVVAEEPTPEVTRPLSPPPLISIGGQYVHPPKIIAVLIPTSAHVSLTTGADIQLRSVLVLDRSVQPLVPCSALPRTVAEKIQEWFDAMQAYHDARFFAPPGVSMSQWTPEEREELTAEPPGENE